MTPTNNPCKLDHLRTIAHTILKTKLLFASKGIHQCGIYNIDTLRISSKDDELACLDIDAYLADEYLGNITMDFYSEYPVTLVAYNSI